MVDLLEVVDLKVDTAHLHEHAAGSFATVCSTAAACAFLMYDVLLTLADEVHYIWPLQWSLTKFIFLFVRWFTLIVQFSIQFINPVYTYTDRECYAYNVYQALASALIITAVDYVLILRIYALYPRSSLVRYATAFLFVAEVVCLAVGMGLSIPALTLDENCIIVETPTTLVVSASAPIAFQAVLFGLTAFKFIEAVKAGWGDVQVVQLLMRDGTWAFFLLFAVLFTEATLILSPSKAFSGVVYGWLNTIFAFCGYRIILNITKIASGRDRRRTPRARSRGPGPMPGSQNDDDDDDNRGITVFAAGPTHTTNIYTQAAGETRFIDSCMSEKSTDNVL